MQKTTTTTGTGLRLVKRSEQVGWKAAAHLAYRSTAGELKNVPPDTEIDFESLSEGDAESFRQRGAITPIFRETESYEEVAVAPKPAATTAPRAAAAGRGPYAGAPAKPEEPLGSK